MQTGLKIVDLHKNFNQVVAIDGLNLEIPKGSIVGLLGQNGAGKSTLVRLLSGIMRPSEGTAYLDNFELVEDVTEIKRITGLLPEEYALYEKLSVKEYVEFIATLYDMDQRDFNERFNILAQQLEIYTFQDRLIETLSKGQKQKVALVTALIHEPEFLFLDEPLANLDIKAQRVVRGIIEEYKDSNRIILIATHLLSNVDQICDYLVIIDYGQARFAGPLSQFKSDFKDLEDAYLNFLEGMSV